MSDDRAAVLLSPAYDRNEYLGAESLGLRAIAAILISLGVRVSVFDEVGELTVEQKREIASARLVGIGTLFTRQIPDAIQLAKEIRIIAPSAHIIMGGQGVAFLWKRVLEDCPSLDSCCMHEGEETVRELWDALSKGEPPTSIDGLFVRLNGAVYTPPRPRNPVSNLDDLPQVYRGDFEMYRSGHATMYTSRGCAAHCSFCQSGNYGNRYHKLPKWRFRSPENIIHEIQVLRGRGIDAISFVDDDFLGGDGHGRTRAEEFARLIKESTINITFAIECGVDEIDRTLLTTLHEVGLRHVLIGIESANEPDDRLFAKKVTTDQIEHAMGVLRDIGIDFSAGFIMFHPLSTLDGIRLNLNFLAKHQIGTYRRVTNRLELYPGAPLLSYYRRRSIEFREERYRLYYSFADPRVAQGYELMRQQLLRFVEVEELAQRIRFRTDRNALASFEKRVAVENLARSISTALVQCATECLDYVEVDGKSSKGLDIGINDIIKSLIEDCAREGGEENASVRR